MITHHEAIEARIGGWLPSRVCIAIVQAIALYALTSAAVPPRHWPADDPALFEPLLLIATLVPLILIAGISAMRPLYLAAWSIVAAAAIGVIAFHDATRGATQTFAGSLLPSLRTATALLAMVFIAHALVCASARAGRFMPSYDAYFDIAWKLAVQVILTLAFVGVFWGVLELGSALFGLLKLYGFGRTIGMRWFYIPATVLATALSIHLTDTSPALLRGVRSLALTLFSILLPLLVVILFGFLVALPFTGLAPLWRTKLAATLLLLSSAALVLLINATYQDGGPAFVASRFKRIVSLVGCLEIGALVSLAVWALALRVGQYGWSVDRVIVAGLLTIAAVYALGYVVAALATSGTLRIIATTNVVAAFVWLAVGAALLTPIADPARIMVADQMARLRSGAVTGAAVDWMSIRFDGARWGKAALEEIAAGGDGALAVRAQDALAATNRYALRVGLPVPDARARTDAFLDGQPFPDELFAPGGLLATSFCLRNNDRKCVLRFIRLRDDAWSLIFLDIGFGTVLQRDGAGAWQKIATLSGPVFCQAARDSLGHGEITREPHTWPDIMAGGVLYTIVAPQRDCPTVPPPATAGKP